MAHFFRYVAMAIMALLAQAAFAQDGGLSGNITDDKGEALPFASVAVMQITDSALVTGAVADMDGKFMIKSPAEGRYFLKLSAVGYKGKTTPAFTVSGPAFSKDFGSLSLLEDVEMLQAVSVEALRPKVITEADKMIVSVEGTALAAGSTAMDVLAKSPGVWVDQDGNIQLNGKGGVKIMIDGRPTYLSSKELQNLLQGMSAENIKDIEIISNPSAKHDAEGTAGVLNINLKKNTIRGMNGSVYAGYQYNNLHGYNGGAKINYKNERWNSSISLDMADRNTFRTLNMVREFNQPGDYAKFDQKTYEDRTDYTPSIKLNTDYDFNANHSVGASASLSQHDTYQGLTSDMELIRTDASQNMRTVSAAPVDEKSKSTTVNLHYVGKLDTLGTRLTADVDYVRLSSMTTSDFINSFTYASDAPAEKQVLGNTNPSSYNIYAARVDFSKAIFGKSKIEAGVKASHVVSDNELSFFSLEDNTKQPIDSMSNHFIYRENILAAYGNFSTKLGDKWSVQAGLRAEQTYSEGESVTLGETIKRNYLNLFPSVFVQQKVSDNYQISYNYSRRISRPRYESLNPFLVYLDPYTIAQGNPNLRPEYTNSFEVTQTFKQTYNLVLGYSVSKDFFTEVPMQNNSTKTTVFGQQNIDRFQNFRATLVAPVEVTPKWSIFNNVMLAYQSFETSFNDLQQVNEALFFMTQVNNTIKLPLGITAELSGIYRGPLAHGLYQIDGAWWVNAGVKRSFMADKLDVSLNVSDIFKSLIETGSADIGANRNNFDQYRGTRGLKLNLRYRFSKGEKFESKNRNSNLEELNRAGGN
ncbi:TonB-dependent receptor domain-containing protein [Cesiribacter sp. SM1]|uniref:TonB-dependent receptor domain-containing protein n=1 Tax=Cesiribacter sp. SM1 TaxID=2861196 RepID=UPI001CD57418|nr:TonB-dependent receptor [Cesiribacter sp. SM1]